MPAISVQTSRLREPVRVPTEADFADMGCVCGQDALDMARCFGEAPGTFARKTAAAVKEACSERGERPRWPAWVIARAMEASMASLPMPEKVAPVACKCGAIYIGSLPPKCYFCGGSLEGKLE